MEYFIYYEVIILKNYISFHTRKLYFPFIFMSNHRSYLSIFNLKLVFTIFLFLAKYITNIYLHEENCFDYYFGRSEIVLVLERSIGSAS